MSSSAIIVLSRASMIMGSLRYSHIVIILPISQTRSSLVVVAFVKSPYKSNPANTYDVIEIGPCRVVAEQNGK